MNSGGRLSVFVSRAIGNAWRLSRRKCGLYFCDWTETTSQLGPWNLSRVPRRMGNFRDSWSDTASIAVVTPCSANRIGPFANQTRRPRLYLCYWSVDNRRSTAEHRASSKETRTTGASSCSSVPPPPTLAERLEVVRVILSNICSYPSDFPSSTLKLNSPDDWFENCCVTTQLCTFIRGPLNAE
jgi:hypothetical protein